MIAYKFLRDGRVGPFSHVRRPEPDEDAPWVQSTGAGVCLGWVHGCRIDDLPEWFDAELWRVELDGDVAVDCASSPDVARGQARGVESSTHRSGLQTTPPPSRRGPPSSRGRPGDGPMRATSTRDVVRRPGAAR